MLIEAAVALAAGLAGLAGTWSPCGFSMIETIGPRGHARGPATTIAACLAFTLGALVGGVLCFGALAAAGALAHGAGETVAYAGAAAVAGVAGVAELRGTTIAPQIRRQLPESWRRRLPMPLAALLYGVLLGLGFTTYVLSFGFFALAAVVLAVGEPALGLIAGLGFGAARALPVALIAPIADRDAGIALTEAMAARPGILRGFRGAGGLALIALAAALGAGAPASAARVELAPGADPAAAGKRLAFQRPDGSAHLRGAGAEVRLPGRDPAAGDGRLAVVEGDEIVLLSATSLEPLGRLRAPGADAVAVSRRWIAWRARTADRDVIRARRVADPGAPGPEKALGRAGGAAQLGRPSLDDNRLVYARATRRRNQIVKRLLGAKRKRRAKSTVLGSRAVGLSNPALDGRALLYVRHTRRADRLKLTRLGGRGPGRTLLSRRRGTLWSTALSARRAYVTQIAGTAPRQRVLSVRR